MNNDKDTLPCLYCGKPVEMHQQVKVPVCDNCKKKEKK